MQQISLGPNGFNSCEVSWTQIRQSIFRLMQKKATNRKKQLIKGQKVMIIGDWTT